MSDDDLMTFLNEGDNLQSNMELGAQQSWRILIIDDEQDVHSATTFALRNTKILGRKLEFLHANSAGQALAILSENRDIAVILLDVVMETPNAGLDLVAEIREKLNNTQSRIILRTGQPNQAPEIEVIRDYDINDYKLKSELTQNKLYASLTSAVRSYQQIKTIESSKEGLDLIVRASADLMSKKGINEFAHGVIIQIAGLLSIQPDGLICVRRNQKKDNITKIIAAAGQFCELIDRPLSEMEKEDAREMLLNCLEARVNAYGSHGVALYLGSSERGDMSCYVASTIPIQEVDRDLLELFCSNISICADNLELVERLQKFAYTDTLVSLPNRRAITEWISRAVDNGEIETTCLAVIDIDNFAEINAVLGQDYGDSLLQAIASRLSERFKRPAIVARVAGDTFAVLGDQNLVTSENVKNAFADYFEVGEDHQLLSVTSGIVRLSETEGDGSDVLKSASIVLKLAKNQSRGDVLHYDGEMMESARNRLGIMRDLRQAFDQEKLFLVFQPKFQLASESISGFEALLRWRDDFGHIVYPETFITIAEQSGLIIRIGEWVLIKAIECLTEIHEQGWHSAHVSVNLSPAQIKHPDLIPMLTRVANSHNFASKFIDLEITESSAIGDSEATLDKLNKIKELGYSLSIDDFGTGFSSLSYLQKMPIDRLKIDKSFVQTSQEGSGRQIVEMIIQLGNTLGLQVIAEGVERESELELMKKLSCDEIQGFLYAKPMAMSDLSQWMEENNARFNS